VAAGVCHTDLTTAATWPAALTPMVFGHEGAGRVEAVGAEVKDLAPGDHVCLTFASCGRCGQCTADHPAYCLDGRRLNFSGGRGDGTTPLSLADGAPLHAGFFGQSSFATHALVHQRGVVRMPPDLPPSVVAPLGCGGQTGAGTVLNRLRPAPGDALVVLGAGGVGLSALMAAVAAGCDPVVAVDPVAALRDVTGGGAHHVVDTTGRPEMLRRAVRALRPRGALALLGLGGEVAFDLMSLLNKGIRVHGVLEGDSDPRRFLPELVRLHRRGLFPVERLVTTFPFEEIGSAVAAMRDGSAVKPVLTFS
jgi:aryl-alcohol dehydrogenase